MSRSPTSLREHPLWNEFLSAANIHRERASVKQEISNQETKSKRNRNASQLSLFLFPFMAEMQPRVV
jgi:hypothetical protein